MRSTYRRRSGRPRARSARARSASSSAHCKTSRRARESSSPPRASHPLPASSHIDDGSSSWTDSLLFNPARVPPGTPIEIATDPGLSLSLRRREVPEPGARGWSRVSGSLRALVSAEPGSQLSVFADAGGHMFAPCLSCGNRAAPGHRFRRARPQPATLSPRRARRGRARARSRAPRRCLRSGRG